MSRRIPLVVVGAVILALGMVTAVAGVGLVAAFGSGNTLATGPHPLTTAARALVLPVARLDGLRVAPSRLGQPRVDVEVTMRAAQPGIFVGVGPAAAVDRYVAGADVDLVTDVEVAPFRLTTAHRPGSGALAAPGAQDFWVARAEARSGTARLSWPVQDGDYRIVVMNADGSPAVDADGRFAVTVPSARAIGLAVLGVGLGLGLLGASVLAWGLRTPAARVTGVGDALPASTTTLEGSRR